MEEYLMFLAKGVTLVALLAAAKSVVKEDKKKESLTVSDLSDAINNMTSQFPKRNESKNVFVLHFNGGPTAHEVCNLRNEIAAIIKCAKEGDEVIVRMHSSGGTVTGYGLGAAQMQRIKDAGIYLTVTIDEIAASGGYLMSCVADKIIVAPFAMVGSIGVVVEMPNFNKTLNALGVEYETLTAGESKRTMTRFGKNTEESRKKVKQELSDIHDLFKDHVSKNRENINITEVSTGECWFGSEAVAFGLCDQVGLFDDYIFEKINDGFNVLKVEVPKGKPKGLFSSIKKIASIMLSKNKG